MAALLRGAGSREAWAALSTLCTRLDVGGGTPTLAMLKVVAEEVTTMKGRFESEASKPLAEKLPALLATLKAREEARETAEARPKGAAEAMGAVAEKSEAEKKQPGSTVGYPRCYSSAVEEMLDDADFIDATSQINAALDKMAADPAAPGSHPNDVLRLVIQLNQTPYLHALYGGKMNV